jgi:hypothetical protein
MLPVRFALLKSGVVTLGVLAWGTTRVSFAGGVGNRIWRGFGWLTLLASMGFLFLFIPVPLVFFVWGVTLTFLLLRNSRTSVSAHTATE